MSLIPKRIGSFCHSPIRGRLLQLLSPIGILVALAAGPSSAADAPAIENPTAVNPLHLPSKGELRIVYASGWQSWGPEWTSAKSMQLTLSEDRVHRLAGVQRGLPPAVAAARVNKDEDMGVIVLRFEYCGQPAPATQFATIRVDDSVTTLGDVSSGIGSVITAARWALPRDLPLVLFLHSPVLGDATNQSVRGVVNQPRPPFAGDEQRLATLGRYRILFATDAAQGAGAQWNLSLNEQGELRDERGAVVDERLDATFKARPKAEVYTMTFSTPKDDAIKEQILANAVARIINVGERSLAKDSSVVLYIKSPAMIEQIGKLRAATTRPALGDPANAERARQALIDLAEQTDDPDLKSALPRLKTDKIERIDDSRINIGRWHVDLVRKTFAASIDGQTYHMSYLGVFTTDPGGRWQPTITRRITGV